MGRKKYTKSYLLEKLHEAFILLKRSPSGRDLDCIPDFPSRGAYRNHFGTINKAKKIAGIPLSIPGHFHPLRIRYIDSRGIDTRTGKRPYSPPQKASLKLRFQILERDNFTCQYCGKTPQDGIKLEVDHITPISKGGTKAKKNLITACFFCNGGKKDVLIAEILSKKIAPPYTNKN